MPRHYGYRFILYTDAAGAWRWRLLASNGKILADSGEAYDSRANALRAIERIKALAGGAPVAALPGVYA